MAYTGKYRWTRWAFDLSVLNKVYNSCESVNSAFPARLTWRICKINFVCTPSIQKPITWICSIAIANTGFKTGQRSFSLCSKQGNKKYIGQILVQYLPLPTIPALETRLLPPGILQNKLHVFIARITYVNMFELHLNYCSVCNIYSNYCYLPNC